MFDLAHSRPLQALLIGPDVRIARGVLTRLKRPSDLTVLTFPGTEPDDRADEHVSAEGLPFLPGSFEVVIGRGAALAGMGHLLTDGGQAVPL